MHYLIPPRKSTKESGRYVIPDSFLIGTIHGEDELPARQLTDDLAGLGVAARATKTTSDAGLIIRRDRSVVHPEGYLLEINGSGIIITAATSAGAYYGVQTLRESIRIHGRELPAGQISDHPDFARRGFYLDCSRGKVPTLDTLFALIEMLGSWKINELQLYVENVFRFARHPRIGEGYSPLNAGDIRAIQEQCALHHIRLVPSLTSLGHFEKILMLPEYHDLGELPGFQDLPGGTTLNPLDPRSLSLVQDMYEEFLPLFDAEDFNACGDEPWELGQGRSKEKAEAEGVGRVYLDFILELRHLSIAQGRRMNLWGDIVLKHPEIIPELPKELVLLNWDYVPDGRMLLRTTEFAEAGLPLVCCPGTNGWQSHGTRLGMSMANVHQFVGIAREHGAEGVLNTDWGDVGHRNSLGVSLHGIAHAAACSWNYGGVAAPDSEEFSRTFVAHLFGDRDGELVPYLKTIGDDEYGHWAYHALLESLHEARGFGHAFSKAREVIEGVELSDDALRAKVAAADHLASGPAPAIAVDRAGRDEFTAVALEEYELANRMNRESARRVIFARAIRGGESTDRGELRLHREELAAIRNDLERLWMKRNRRSRLDDSLAGFDEALRELDEHA